MFVKEDPIHNLEVGMIQEKANMHGLLSTGWNQVGFRVCLFGLNFESKPCFLVSLFVGCLLDLNSGIEFVRWGTKSQVRLLTASY